MLRTATRDDLPFLRQLLEDANDAPYDLGLVAEEKCFGAGFAGEPVVRIHDGGGVAVTCGKALRILAVARTQRRRGIGTELVRDAMERGATIAAAEAGNYFTPGIVETDLASRALLRKLGWQETRWTTNLRADLRDFGPTPDVRRATHDERERVLAFIEREFGRIWRFECSRAFDRTEPALFVTELGGEIAGFAGHELNNRGLAWFGPTGVAKSLRGRGLGRALLLASLNDLRGLGYQSAVIPWTDALEFYRRSCGAEAAHRFVTMSRD